MAQDGGVHGTMSIPLPIPRTPSTPGYMPPNSRSTKDMVMHVSFFWGKDVTVLFEGWTDGHLDLYILALAFIFFLAAAVEILSFPSTLKPAAGSSPVAGALGYGVVYAFRMVLAYSVMLAVMSFNIGIFIVAVAGHAFGVFLVKYRTFSAAARAETITLNTRETF